MSRERFRYKDGKVVVTFSSDERAFLADVLDFLATIPTTGDDPATQRLHVPVYLDDPDANAEWWRLMGDELSTARMSDRAVFLRVIEGQAARPSSPSMRQTPFSGSSMKGVSPSAPGSASKSRRTMTASRRSSVGFSITWAGSSKS